MDNNIFLVLLSHIFTLGQLIISQSILILSSNLISELMACLKENPKRFFPSPKRQESQWGPTKSPIQRALGFCPWSKAACVDVDLWPPHSTTVL